MNALNPVCRAGSAADFENHAVRKFDAATTAGLLPSCTMRSFIPHLPRDFASDLFVLLSPSSVECDQIISHWKTYASGKEANARDSYTTNDRNTLLVRLGSARTAPRPSSGTGAAGSSSSPLFRMFSRAPDAI